MIIFASMETSLKISLFLLFASYLGCLLITGAETGAQLQTYIVHVQQPEGSTPFLSSEDREAWYRSFLPESALHSDEPRIVFYYQSAISGFAARLTSEEVKAMETKEGFLQAYPDRFHPLLTTHTPDFLGLRVCEGLWNDSRLGEGVIIGMLDTGITPGHPSFLNDSNIRPPPPKWKGACHLPANACNNKLIGAKDFVSGSNHSKAQPLDDVGHGTHTAGTAAGSFVKNAAVLGQAEGTAVGMAPYAHLAIYKVCVPGGCIESAIVAGIDAAIEDGVDVISMSLGSGPISSFYQDSMAIASFSAMEKGVFVSCSAGNSGPNSMSVSNGYPWVLTVAASTTDRTVRATVRLGDGRKFYGQSLYQPSNFSSSPLHLVRPNGSLCSPSALNETDVKGKVVLCTGGGTFNSLYVKEAGGAAMIQMNQDYYGYTTSAKLQHLPASHVSHADGTKIEEYYNSTANPVASITFEGTKFDNVVPAPAVAAFSSRGPNIPSPGILKPDITGPGVDILAAWNTPIEPPSASKQKKAAAAFDMISGTSMSAPHLSGIAALLKKVHPDWSPAAIRSAIVTTADTRNDGEWIRDEQMKPASYYSMGAGHVNANRASDPGLVYNLTADDYIPYLCGLGYTDKQVSSVVKRCVKCSKVKSVAEGDLNYPSMVVSLPLGSKPVTVSRTVTNVGEPKSKYEVKVEAPAGVSVKVRPHKLYFSKKEETKKFTVSFSRKFEIDLGVSEGNLKWVSGKHVVTSPIVVHFEQQ